MISLIIASPPVQDEIFEELRSAFQSTGKRVLETEDLGTPLFDKEVTVTENLVILLRNAIFFLDSRRSNSQQVIQNCSRVVELSKQGAAIFVLTSHYTGIDKRVRTLVQRGSF